jgi:mannose-6-phosphate isomerase-like protein (cupin superfamily)
MSTRIVAPNGGEVIGDAPDRRVEILYEHDAVHATWSRMGPGRAGADPHVHREHHDIFYVLAGTLTVRLRDAELAVPAGKLAWVPPLVIHGFRNASPDTELRYLNFHTPGSGFADYMRGLRDGIRVPFDQYDPPPDGGADPATVIVAEQLELPQIAVNHGPPDIVFEADGHVVGVSAPER